MTKIELIQTIENAMEYVMIKFNGKGYTIVTWTDGGPNIGEWDSNDGGVTFKDAECLITGFSVNGKTIADDIENVEILECV